MTQLISLHTAAKSDLAAVFLLEQQVFGAHIYPDFFFRQVLDCWPDGLMLAKTASGKLVGYQLAVKAAKSDDYWIWSLAVSPDFRGKGIGRQLIQASIASAPREVKRILLTVAPENPARQLYESCGFTAAGFEADYFGAGASRMVMALSLSAYMAEKQPA